jgi:hypothetical protein
MYRFTVAVAFSMLAVAMNAQSGASSTASEDIIELSPFIISAEGEPAYKGIGAVGNRAATPLIDPRSALQVPGAAVSILKRAEAVAIQFVISHAGEKQEIRNQELYASLSAIEAAMKRVKGAKLEQREVRFTGGDRKFFSASSGASLTSFVSILVIADLPAEMRVADRVKEIRDAVSATKLIGRTKYSDGSVGLYLRNPDQYRREILEKVFEDFAFLKKGFSDEFEIAPSGLMGRVKARVASESDIELWIEYSFGFRSIRELSSARK